MKKNELNYKELKNFCNPNIFKFETTAELDNSNVVYGQDRGIKALEFGLSVDSKGYNLYLEGPSGVGKTMYTKKYVTQIAAKKKVPDDWCYIYNFENPNEPIAVSLSAGYGKDFRNDMNTFIDDMTKNIKLTFGNEDFEKQKNLMQSNFEQKKNNLLEKLNKTSMKSGFQVKAAQNGVYMMPVIDGKAIEEEEFNKLDDKTKKAFEENSSVVQEQIIEAINQIKLLEKENNKKIEEWQSNIALITINAHINPLKLKYKKNIKIVSFLDNIKSDILKNLSLFINTELPKEISKPQKEEQLKPWLNYRVNLFVDNSNLSGSPVIMDSNYQYHNLFGKLEYENQYGMLKTDYTMLKPGLLHKANGGYIILQASDLLTNQICYDSLKKALLVKELNIENNIEQRSYMVMISLKPEPIPLNVKVLLLGDANIYHALLALDPDFKKLFKIKVEFEETAPRTEANIIKLARFVHSFSEKENMLPLDKEAMAKVVEFASKISDDKNKLSTRFNEIGEIVAEASTWAKSSKKKIVTKEYIDKALAERIDRVKKYDSKYLEMIEENTLLINTSGYEIGVINGLTIMTVGDYTFGKPTKITANTYIGKNGIINIERETQMSGPTHSKGVLILSGYLGETFAQDFPLSLTSSLCFEQLYNGVDGDSASSTELYAILSSLSEMPINQSIAVTGSVNQKGFIQPIGGINEKIEGFYQICKMRGLDGTHGVIMPAQNVKNLNLSDEIINSVKEDMFHIYAISTIDEGIEILTGVPAGKKNKDGKFSAGTIKYLAYEKLKHYSENAKPQNYRRILAINNNYRTTKNRQKIFTCFFYTFYSAFGSSFFAVSATSGTFSTGVTSWSDTVSCSSVSVATSLNSSFIVTSFVSILAPIFSFVLADFPSLSLK
ncbi:MAG: AAA family ATPase [Clostridia bacterium]|nr:AAA family ATPase [Clostridia bacterium]